MLYPPLSYTLMIACAIIEEEVIRVEGFRDRVPFGAWHLGEVAAGTEKAHHFRLFLKNKIHSLSVSED